MTNTTSVKFEIGSAYPPGSPKITLSLSVGFVLHNFYVVCVMLLASHFVPWLFRIQNYNFESNINYFVPTLKPLRILWAKSIYYSLPRGLYTCLSFRIIYF